MSASFTHPSQSLTFSHAPQRPPRSLSLRQPYVTATGAAACGYPAPVAEDLLTLQLRLTAAEHTALTTFFRSTARGSAESFIYTDSVGSQFTARFSTPQLPVIEAVAGGYKSTVTLRVTPIIVTAPAIPANAITADGEAITANGEVITE